MAVDVSPALDFNAAKARLNLNSREFELGNDPMRKLMSPFCR